VAAAVGTELFRVDGPMWAEMSDDPKDIGQGGYQWIKGRKLVGWNWLETNKQLFPNGIRTLSDYAHEKGLLFGLYARTEGRNMMMPGRRSMADTVGDMIEKYGLDMYRHDTSYDQWHQGGINWVTSAIRDGFKECILWRHYERFYKDAERIAKKYPNVILQQAHAGGARMDLATVGRWHESFQSDFTGAPFVYQMMAGFSVYLPPEIMESPPYGMLPLGEITPDNTTVKRCIYALGNVPCVYWTLLPGKVSEIKPDELKQWLKYSELYKTFIRPLLSTCKVYHHTPINAKGNWDAGPWFVMEFTSPDRTKGWAIVISYPENQSLTYLFRPKGLDAQKKYSVTFDNTGKTETFTGSKLMQGGLSIQLSAERRSELLLFNML